MSIKVTGSAQHVLTAVTAPPDPTLDRGRAATATLLLCLTQLACHVLQCQPYETVWRQLQLASQI